MCRPNNKISTEAAQAFIARRPFRRSNTAVVVSPSNALLLLHGTVIGENSEARGLHLTMAGWGTMTTAARLNAVMRALGRDARWHREDGVWHYGDRVLDDLDEIVEV
jgi:hypothetical protein